MEIAGVCRHLGEGGGAGQKRGFRRKPVIPEARVAAVWTSPAACLWAAGRSPMQGDAGLSSDPPHSSNAGQWAQEQGWHRRRPGRNQRGKWATRATQNSLSPLLWMLQKEKDSFCSFSLGSSISDLALSEQ